jgi:acetyl-CoA synthetase
MESSTTTHQPNLDSILHERRVFPPPAEFAAQAHVKSLEQYEALYQRSIQDPEGFWAEIASELHWFSPWSRVLDW